MANPKIITKIPEAADRKRMLCELRSKNPYLTPEKIAFLSGIEKRAAESYLWDSNRYPDMFCLYACFCHARYNRSPHSTELRRVCARFESRWIRKGDYFNQTPQIYGDHTSQKRKYIYHGERLNVADIAGKSGKKFHTVYTRIYKSGLEFDSDVTGCIDAEKKRGRKKNIKGSLSNG